MNNILILDSWERNDNCVAQLSIKQMDFINKLDNICKTNQLNKSESNSEKSSKESTTYEQSIPEFNNLFDFDEWFEKIDNKHKNEIDFRFKKLIEYNEECKELLSFVTTILVHLDELQEQYRLVSNKTKSLHTSCEALLQQQHGLIVAVETINEKMTYFNELQPISKKLSSPTMLVLNESLMPMLSRLDECILYLESKHNYKETAIYLKQYKHLQSQALSTIRTHVIKTLQQTSQQVMPDSKDALAPNDSIFTLFYGKFQTNAHRIKTLMQQIEERTNQSEIYKQYLSECHQCYFNVRESLIGPVLSLAIDEMVTSYKRNYCALIRNTSNMLIHICQDEYQLYFQFFTQHSSSLNDFLDKNCQKLYDTLRPVVIHLEHLESLSEICYILKHEMIEENVINQTQELDPFIKSMQHLLEDTQERLFYRCNVYIQTNIIGYIPGAGDLAYPEKLEMMKSIAENLNETKGTDYSLSRSNSVSSVVSNALSDISLINTNDKSYENARKEVQPNRSPADLHGMWFPTVRRTLMCLTKLYRSLDKPTFQGLSQEVLAACIESLDIAHNQITKRKSLLDGQLFFIKHLLIIREQIAPFHIEITLREVALDFSRTKTAAYDLIQKRENLFSLTTNNSLLKFLFEGAPQVTEKIVDSQKAVDNKIKIKCEQFISHATELLMSSLINLLNIAKTLQRENILKSHEIFSSVENLKKSIDEALDQLKENYTLIESKMTLYLANKETQSILFRPIKAKIQQNYEELEKLIKSNYSENEQQVLGLQTFVDLNII